MPMCYGLLCPWRKLAFSNLFFLSFNFLHQKDTKIGSWLFANDVTALCAVIILILMALKKPLLDQTCLP